MITDAKMRHIPETDQRFPGTEVQSPAIGSQVAARPVGLTPLKAVLAGLLVSMTMSAFAYQAELISRSQDPLYFGPFGNRASGFGCSVADDGLRTVLYTQAFNLFENDRNANFDLMIYFRVSQSLEPVFVTGTGEQTDGGVGGARISGNGRYLLFLSDAPNLGVTGLSRVFRHDLDTGQTIQVSVDQNGMPFPTSVNMQDISADGELILFTAESQLWLRDLAQNQTQLLSLGIDGLPGNQFVSSGVIAGQGNIVAFGSTSSNLVPGDTNGESDVFIADLALGTLERIVGPGGVEPNGSSSSPSVSADGRWVAFASLATNLVPGASQGFSDVFLHDRLTGLTTRLSEDAHDVGGNGTSQRPVISADGRFVLFESFADNLLPGLSGNVGRLFLYDHQLQQLTQVAVDAGSPAYGCLVSSGDDVLIGFHSNAHPLLPASMRKAQIFLESFDASGTQPPVTLVISQRNPPIPTDVANGNSDYPVVSANGNFLAFSTSADNLIGVSQPGSVRQIVRLNLATGQNELVSQTSSDPWIFGSEIPSISANGNRIAWHSRDSNLVPGISNGVMDVFVRDMQLGQTRRVSVDSTGVEANGGSDFARISANGNSVAFRSSASNLVPDDTNGRRDIFVHDLDSGITERVSVSTAGAQSTAHSEFPDISADGRFVVFESAGNLLNAPVSVSGTQIWLRDRQLDETSLISAAPDGTPGDNFSFQPRISANGRWIAFASLAGNLDPAYPNPGSAAAVYLHDRQLGTTRLISLDDMQQPLNSLSVTDLQIAGDGQSVMFVLMTDDEDEPLEIHVYRTAADESRRIVPETVDGLPPNRDLFVGWGALSFDGRMIYLASVAGNLTRNTPNGLRNIYRIDLDQIFRDGFE